MMKNKKGFIAISTIYTFFVVFMMILVLVIVTYANNRYSFDPYKTNIKTKILSRYETFSNDISFFNNRVQAEKDVERSGSWRVYNETSGGGNRYEGLGPDNYVCFGTDEYPCPTDNLYRVVGSFTNEVHGLSGKTLVKLVKQTPFEARGYAKPEDIIDYLETAFWDTLDNPKEGVLNHKFTNYKDMIENVWWYYNPIDTHLKVQDAYKTERKAGSSDSKQGHVGLLSASDYGFSTIVNGNLPSGAETTCTRDAYLNEYNGPGKMCFSYNWLNREMWLLNKSTVDDEILYIDEKYNVASGDNTLTKDLYPSFYLKSDVYIVDGNGSLGSPYTLNIKSEA